MDDTSCILILLISCWVVAASLMAENTNVGMAVFIADITSMCGLGLDGAGVLLSARLSAAAAISLSSPVLRCCSLFYFVRWAIFSVTFTTQ